MINTNEKEYKEYFKNHIKDFYNLTENTKVVLYQNPKDFRVSFIEDINPIHIKIIYGRRWNIKGSCEKIAKIIIPSFILSQCMVMFMYTSLIVFGIFTSFILIGLYVSNTYKLIDCLFSFYKLFGCKIYESRKFNYRYLWI